MFLFFILCIVFGCVFSFLISLCFPNNRMDVGREDKSGLMDSRTPESSISMRHLIAVAQAKRKQAQSQSFFLGISNSTLVSNKDLQGRSPSPSEVQGFLSTSSSALQADLPGSNQLTNLASPSTHGRQSASQIQLDIEEISERRVSSGHQTAGGSLSGGTEAAVARDAFEGMIETLSRTKESIGRATRLAIDCAKYGIANEVGSLACSPSFYLVFFDFSQRSLSLDIIFPFFFIHLLIDLSISNINCIYSIDLVILTSFND